MLSGFSALEERLVIPARCVKCDKGGSIELIPAKLKRAMGILKVPP